MTALTESSVEFTPLDPSFAEYPYAGWVPTVNGNLSFRHIGESHHPTPARYANVSTKDRRIILAFQYRPLSDALFPWMLLVLQWIIKRIISCLQWIIRKLPEVIPYRIYITDRINIKGEFFFVLAATAEGPHGDTKKLCGTIYIYKSKKDWKEKIKETVRETVYNLQNARFSNDDSIDDKITGVIEKFNKANTELALTADIAITFEMNRNGEVYLSKPTFQNENLHKNSVVDAIKQGHDFYRWIADQSYFFLRDVSHRHQHHPPSTDTILVLQERKNYDPTPWRRNLIYSLQYAVIRSKRHGEAKSVLRASGILAYCMSFLAICGRSLGEAVKKDIPQYNDAALMQSLQARLEEEKISTDKRKTSKGHFFTYFLTFTTITIALFIMLVQPMVGYTESDKVLKHQSLTDFSEFLTATSIFFIVVYFTFFMLFPIYFFGNLSTKPLMRFAFKNDLLEFGNVKRKRTIAVFSILSILTLATTVVIAWPAIKDLYFTFKNALEFLSPSAPSLPMF